MMGRSKVGGLVRVGIGSALVLAGTGGSLVFSQTAFAYTNGCNDPGVGPLCWVSINGPGTNTVQGGADNFLDGECNLALYNGGVADIGAANRVTESTPEPCPGYYDDMAFTPPKAGSGDHTYTAVLWYSNNRGAIETDTFSY
jgi:hypothetical protein